MVETPETAKFSPPHDCTANVHRDFYVGEGGGDQIVRFKNKGRNGGQPSIYRKTGERNPA